MWRTRSDPSAADVEDFIGVAVADIVGRRQAQPARVVAGADDVTGRGRELIGEHGFAARPPLGVGVGERGQSGGTGADVEFVDDGVGGGEQQGVAAGVLVGQPCLERHVGGGLVGADMHAAVVDVEADARRVAGPQSQ